MRAFAGAEPLVGVVTGLRTFRVDATGTLLPLYSAGAWYDGTNTAGCHPPTDPDRPRDAPVDHHVPDPACECGFYAYGSPAAAARARQSRHVQAVVSCWGGVVAGTQGVRAQYARVDALWLHPDAPSWLRSRVARRYPSARLYPDVATMLAEHPLSVLPCYGPPDRRRRVLRRALAAVLGTLLLVLGLLPRDLLTGTPGVREAWVGLTGTTALLACWLLLGGRVRGGRSAGVVLLGLAAWLVAPAFGLAGWLLRLPVLRALAVTAGGALLALRPHHFPVAPVAVERTPWGVATP